MEIGDSAQLPNW